MMHRTDTRYDTVRLLEECVRLVRDGRGCEISVAIGEDGTGRFSIAITGRAHTFDGADETPTVDLKPRRRDDTTEDAE